MTAQERPLSPGGRGWSPEATGWGGLKKLRSVLPQVPNRRLVWFAVCLFRLLERHRGRDKEAECYYGAKIAASIRRLMSLPALTRRLMVSGYWNRPSGPYSETWQTYLSRTGKIKSPRTVKNGLSIFCQLFFTLILFCWYSFLRYTLLSPLLFFGQKLFRRFYFAGTVFLKKPAEKIEK